MREEKEIELLTKKAEGQGAGGKKEIPLEPNGFKPRRKTPTS